MSLVDLDFEKEKGNAVVASSANDAQQNLHVKGVQELYDRDEVLRKLLEQETNNECFDCHKRHPAWASLNNAVFLCIDCCGKHRCYGVHISFIRSVTLDNWKKEHLASMMCGGHERLRNYVAERPALQNLKELNFYSHPEMEKYRRMIYIDSRAYLGIDGEKELAEKEAERLKWEKIAQERRSQGLSSSSISSHGSSSSSSASSASPMTSRSAVPAPFVARKKEPSCCGCFG